MIFARVLCHHIELLQQLHGDTLLYFNNPGEDKARGELLLNSSSTVGSLSSGEPTGFQVIFAGGKALKVKDEVLRGRCVGRP